MYQRRKGLSNANSISFSKNKGKMLENTIFQHLRRKYDKIFYFKEKNECDFLIKEKEKIIYAIQVCYELNEDNQKWINTSIKRNKTRQRHNNNFKSRR